MKKLKVKIISALLMLTLLLSAGAQTVSAAETAETAASAQTLSVPVLRGAGAAVATAVAKRLLGRALQEVSAYSISHDVPVLGGIAKLMLTPEQRANMKQRVQVEEILTKVTAIEQGVAQIQEQVNYISVQMTKLSSEIQELKSAVNLMQWQVASLEQKLQQQEAAIALNSSIQHLHEISGKYKAAWNAYTTMISAVEKLAAVNQKIDEAGEIDTELKTERDVAEKYADAAVTAFINILSEGGGATFASDLANLQARVWNAQNPSSSYLGAYEAYLRISYPFEHQITDEMIVALRSCTDMMTQIFMMYTEYYSYMKANHPDDERYESYTDRFFESIGSDLEKFLIGMAEDCGVGGYMVEEPLSDEEIAEFTAMDESFVPPESIDTTVTINGVTYQCYKVRSNSDYQYYIILKDFVSTSQLVSKKHVSYFWKETDLYRPTFILDHEYTDDGLYKMLSNGDKPSFISLSFNGILSHLRLDGGLLDLPQNTEHVLLYENDCDDIYNNGTLWNVKALSASAMGVDGALDLRTDHILNGSTGTKAIAIYRSVVNDSPYVNYTYTVKDKYEIEHREISVSDNQTLDLTQITVDVSDVTINVIGRGRIVSNPKITLKNSEIRIVTDEAVVIENLNVSAKAGDYAAIKILSDNSNVSFSGNNTASGTASGNVKLIEYYEDYVPGMPICASHGVYTRGDAKIKISGTATFRGADGGAGVCVSNKLTVTSGSDGAKLVAKGSKYQPSSGANVPEAVGAGIGGSFSGTIAIHTTVLENGNSVTSFEYCSDRSKDFVGSNAELHILGITVEASGAVANKLSSDDIGGADAAGRKYDIKSGTISGSSVKLERAAISSNVVTRESGNTFMPDIYTISAYTHGSNGVTKSGVMFKLHGEKGVSNWITASQCGRSKGDWSGSFEINSVGKLLAVEVKTVADNAWFAGKIEIKSKFGGENLVVYGGRWIGTTSVMLRPSDVVYKVTIETGSANYSGTNSEVHLKLKDKYGKETNNYNLCDIHYDNNACEREDVTDVWRYAPDGFAECIGAYLSSDNSGVSPDWKVDKISIERVSGGGNDSYSVSPGYWFRTSHTANFGKYVGYTGAFYIEVKTTKKSNAGTDSSIYLTINGALGSSPEISLGDFADNGNNFESGDLDTMFIGFDIASIGSIQSLTIRKDNGGWGPDWHLQHIKIQEMLPDDKLPQTYQFSYGDWISDETVTLNNRQTISTLRSQPKFDREILSGLKANEDGSYTLTVDREVTLTESTFELIAENEVSLTVIMTDDDKPLYEVVFDGTQFDSSGAVVLGKDYSFADGRSLFEFLKNAELPSMTVIRIHAANIGFVGENNYTVFRQNDDGGWQRVDNVINSDGIIEFYAENVKKMMISDSDNAWIVSPSIENWVSGESAAVPVAESLYGSVCVRYVGVANDNTTWDSSEAPTKAGSYTAYFTVSATDSYDGLECSVDFTVAEGENPATEKDSENTEKVNLSWLWIVISAVSVCAIGFAVYWFVLRKRLKNAARDTSDAKDK